MDKQAHLIVVIPVCFLRLSYIMCLGMDRNDLKARRKLVIQ